MFLVVNSEEPIRWTSTPFYCARFNSRHDLLPHHIPELHDRACGLHRDAAGDVGAHRRRALSILARFWTKSSRFIRLGVVSGLVASYQFGTNWSRFSVVTGNVIGPAIATRC